MSSVRAACIQLCSGRDPAANLDITAELIRAAHGAGAAFILTPENTNLMEARTEPLLQATHAEETDPSLTAFRSLAAELEVWLSIGGMAIRVARDKVANRGFLIAPDGTVRARYDKIHMFDVSLPNGEVYRESKNYRPGRDAVLADTPWGPVGMTICYDVRFPSLYRLLARAGATMLTVPSAFTKATGEAHWHTLLRARAIENCAYVIAPAQHGIHDTGRETFGHSLIVDPWGRVLADGGEGVGYVTADLDMIAVREARAQLPVLTHDRPLGLTRF